MKDLHINPRHVGGTVPEDVKDLVRAQVSKSAAKRVGMQKGLSLEEVLKVLEGKR